MPVTFPFRPQHRIKRGLDFKRAYDAKASARDDLLLMFIAGNGLEHARLGLSVSRKVGNAVVRNQWKRLIREAFRLELSALPPGLDIVTIPVSREAPELAGLRRSLPALVRRAMRRLEKKG